MLLSSRMRTALLAAVVVAAPLGAPPARANDCAQLHARLPELRAARVRHEANIRTLDNTWSEMTRLGRLAMQEADLDRQRAFRGTDESAKAREIKISSDVRAWVNETGSRFLNDVTAEGQALRQTEQELSNVQRALTNQDCYSKKNRAGVRPTPSAARSTPNILRPEDIGNRIGRTGREPRIPRVDTVPTVTMRPPPTVTMRPPAVRPSAVRSPAMRPPVVRPPQGNTTVVRRPPNVPQGRTTPVVPRVAGTPPMARQPSTRTTQCRYVKGSVPKCDTR